MSTSKSFEAEGIGNAPVKPKGALGWRHFEALLMFLGLTLAYMVRVNISVAIVAMVDETSGHESFTWSTTDRGYILSSFFWGYTVTQIPSGLVAQRWGAQKLFGILMFLCGLTNLLVPIAARYGGWQTVVVCRVVMGLTQGCVLPSVHTLLAKWAPPEERGRLGTVVYAGAQFGTVITMASCGYLAASAWGWHCIFYISGILTMAWSVVWFIFGKDTPAKHPYISIEEKQYIEQSLNTLDPAEKLAVPWLHIATSVPMWALLIVHCGQNWGYWTLVTEMPTYIKSVLNYEIEKNGLVSSLPYLAMWILSFPFSWCTDFVLNKGVSRGASRKIANTIGHWGPAVALIVLGSISVNNSMVVIAILVIAVGLNAGSLCGYQLNHLDLSPNYAGTMMSITNCIAGFMSILAPLICGLIVTDEKDVGQWSIVWFVSAGIYLAGNLVFIVFGSGEVQWWNDPRSPQFNRGFVSDENIDLEAKPSSGPK